MNHQSSSSLSKQQHHLLRDTDLSTLRGIPAPFTPPTDQRNHRMMNSNTASFAPAVSFPPESERNDLEEELEALAELVPGLRTGKVGVEAVIQQNDQLLQSQFVDISALERRYSSGKSQAFDSIAIVSMNKSVVAPVEGIAEELGEEDEAGALFEGNDDILNESFSVSDIDRDDRSRDKGKNRGDKEESKRVRRKSTHEDYYDGDANLLLTESKEKGKKRGELIYSPDLKFESYEDDGSGSPDRRYMKMRSTNLHQKLADDKSSSTGDPTNVQQHLYHDSSSVASPQPAAHVQNEPAKIPAEEPGSSARSLSTATQTHDGTATQHTLTTSSQQSPSRNQSNLFRSNTPMHLPNFKPATGCTNASDFIVRCFVARLRSGITVIKHGRSRWCKSRLRTLLILPDGRTLTWRPADGEPNGGNSRAEQTSSRQNRRRTTQLDLLSCAEVRHAWSADPSNPMFTGTPILRQKCEAANAHKSFALIFDKRTVDITAVTADQCKVLLEGFSALCFRLQLAHYTNSNKESGAKDVVGTTCNTRKKKGAEGEDDRTTASVTLTNNSTGLTGFATPYQDVSGGKRITKNKVS